MKKNGEITTKAHEGEKPLSLCAFVVKFLDVLLAPSNA
jgi:hypothetical protein